MRFRIFPKYAAFTWMAIATGCFPILEKSPLEIWNIFNFLNRRPPNSEAIVENRSINSLLYSKAYGSIEIQNLDDPPVILEENGTSEIPILSTRGDGTLDFRIVTQPTDHDCRIINPNEAYAEGSTTLEINCFSLLGTTPISGGIIPPLTPIAFRFSDTTDFDPTNMSDDSFTNVNLESPGNPDFVLSDTLSTNDTLTVIAPAPGWTPGVGKFVEFNFRNLDGKNFASGGKRIEFTVASAIRYVSQSGSDFGNDGLTPATSFRNIQIAIDDMDPCPDKACLVLVEQGSYNANEFGTSIFMRDGISLSGSFLSGSNFTSRDPSLRNSIIFFPFVPGHCGNVAVQCVPLVIDGVNSPTVLEGFTIESIESKDTVGVSVLNSDLMIANTTIRGGTASFDSSDSVGLRVTNSNLIIRNSTIEGGDCTGDFSKSIGLFLFADNIASPVSPNIQNSLIRSLGCMSTISASYGIRFNAINGNITLENIGNTPIQSGNATEESIGISGFNSTANIQGVQNISTGNASITAGISLTLDNRVANIGTYPGSVINILTGTASNTNMGIVLSTIGDTMISNVNIIQGNTSNLGSGNVKAYGLDINGNGEFNLSQTNINMGNVSSATGDAEAWGIRLNNNNSLTSIQRNSIKMANVTSGSLFGRNFGIEWQGASAGQLINNMVYGGNTNRNSTGILIRDNGQNLRVYHNTIAMGPSTGDPSKTNSFEYSSTSILSAGLELRNNIFLNQPATVSCVNLYGLPTGAIQANVFWNCSALMNDTNGGLSYDQICTPNGELGRNACTTPPGDFAGNGLTFERNLNMNPNLSNAFTDPFDFNLTPSSPCQITQSINQLPSVIDDRLMTPRNPPTVSLGAIEYAGGCVP
jgi:hypothetical protein